MANSTRKITLIALVSAFCVIGRLGLLSLPNVQPITVVVIWITLELGLFYGVAIGSISILISNLLVSMGPWTLYQMVSFALVCVCALLLRPLWRKRKQFLRLAWIVFPIFAGMMGYLYGFIISIFWVFSILISVPMAIQEHKGDKYPQEAHWRNDGVQVCHPNHNCIDFLKS